MDPEIITQITAKYNQYKTALTPALTELQDQIHSFTPDYESESQLLLTSDGSQVCYWHAPYAELYLAGVSAAQVVQAYHHQPHPSYETIQNTYDARQYALDLEEIRAQCEKDKCPPYASIIGELMARFEKQRLIRLARQYDHQLVLVDGSISSMPYNRLSPQILDQLDPDLSTDSTIHDLISACADYHHTLVGISKDSSLIYDAAGITYERALALATERFGVSPGCYYYQYKPAEADELDDHQIYTCYARLHPRAVKWYRIDVITESKSDIPSVLAHLAAYCQLDASPGLPAAQIIAHKTAVQLCRQREIMSRELLTLLQSHGLSSEEACLGVSEISGTREFIGRYHDLLDQL